MIRGMWNVDSRAYITIFLVLSPSLKISCYKFHHAIFRAPCHQYSCYILLIWLFDLVVVIILTVGLFSFYASKILWFSSIFMEFVLSSLDWCIFELSFLTVQFKYSWLIRRYAKYWGFIQFLFIEFYQVWTHVFCEPSSLTVQFQYYWLIRRYTT